MATKISDRDQVRKLGSKIGYRKIVELALEELEADCKRDLEEEGAAERFIDYLSSNFNITPAEEVKCYSCRDGKRDCQCK